MRRGTRTMSGMWAAVALAIMFGEGCALFQTRARVEPPPEPKLHLVLKLGERKLYVMEPHAPKPLVYPVAIGRKGYETPTGNFEIREMVENPDFVVFDWNNPSKVKGRIPPGPNNPLGKRWIAFARSPGGWEVGFHGTTKTQFLGQAVSHGCVRMANDDVVKLFDKVKLGTPVVVEP